MFSSFPLNVGLQKRTGKHVHLILVDPFNRIILYKSTGGAHWSNVIRYYTADSASLNKKIKEKLAFYYGDDICRPRTCEVRHIFTLDLDEGTSELFRIKLIKSAKIRVPGNFAFIDYETLYKKMNAKEIKLSFYSEKIMQIIKNYAHGFGFD